MRKPESLSTITAYLLATYSRVPSLWPLRSSGLELTEVGFILHTAPPEEL